jgi:hypothetical protein
MENKYYIPDITELFVSYKYEMISYSSNNYGTNKNDYIWKKFILDRKDYFSDYKEGSFFEIILSRLSNNHIRTKYLDKQDLENEGWIQENEILFKLERDLTDRWYLLFDKEKQRIEFCDNNDEFEFAGTIKSINEFRNIIKYLEIK